MEDVVALAHLVAAAGYAGFQWCVRVVVYPQLAAAGRAHPAGSPALEASHQRRISHLVGPLFAALVATTALVVVVGASPRPAALLAAACTAVVLGATALGAVPRHRALARGFDEAAVAALLRWDAVRVVAATVQVAAALALVS